MKKRIDDYRVMPNIQTKDFARDRELKAQAFIHHQLSADRFKKMWRYAWHAAGYIDERGERFETPVQFCFRQLGANCAKQNCQRPPFVRCARCEQEFCYQCSMQEFHNHLNN